MLELDGLWTRTRAGRRELKVVRDADTVALWSFSPWAEVIDRCWQLGAQGTRHPVSYGDAAIATGIDSVYGRGAPHQLCLVHLRREYRRNLGGNRLCRNKAAAAGGEPGGGAEMGVTTGAIDRRGGGLLAPENAIPKGCVI